MDPGLVQNPQELPRCGSMRLRAAGCLRKPPDVRLRSIGHRCRRVGENESNEENEAYCKIKNKEEIR